VIACLVRLHVQMEAQLFVEIAFDRSRPEQDAQSSPELSHG
jgi:hypothetical protein